jgi:hypothetical protein
MDLTIRDVATLLAVVVSTGALSLGVFNYRRASKLDKRDLFLKIHERLIEPDVVTGRRLLYSLRSKQEAASLVYREDDMTKVYRALAMFDVLALYAENGWIDEGTVLESGVTPCGTRLNRRPTSSKRDTTRSGGTVGLIIKPLQGRLRRKRR